MPADLLPPAVRIAFVPFCVDSLSRTKIERVFMAHGVSLSPNANPFSKTNLVDAYYKRFDFNSQVDDQKLRDIIADVFALVGDLTTPIASTFLAVCTRNGVVLEKGRLVNVEADLPPHAAVRPARAAKQRLSLRKILFLASSPVDQARLRLDKEVREIREGLQRSNERDSFELIPWFAVKISDLRRSLLDHSPQIVHFAGHGDVDGILVESDNGRAVQVPVGALAGLFELCQPHVECVVLNACYSQAQAEAIAKHIPNVIGMRASINDRPAIEFAVGFYDALGAGRTIEEAFRFATNAVAFAGIPADRTPVLMRR